MAVSEGKMSVSGISTIGFGNEIHESLKTWCVNGNVLQRKSYRVSRWVVGSACRMTVNDSLRT